VVQAAAGWCNGAKVSKEPGWRKKTNRIAAVCLVYEEEIKSCLRVPEQDKQLSTGGLLV
jgi:hypothetical protein